MGLVASRPLALTQYDIEEVQDHVNKRCACTTTQQCGFLTFLAALVTSLEIQSLFARFRALDRRHKGYISADELLSVPELAINPLAQRLVQLFENCNFKDFVRLLSAFSSKSSAEEQLRFVFDLYDVDGDGGVSRADLLTIMRNRAGSALTCVGGRSGVVLILTRRVF